MSDTIYFFLGILSLSDSSPLHYIFFTPQNKLDELLHRAKKENQPVLYTGIRLYPNQENSRQVSLKVTYRESNKLAGDFLVVNIENDTKPQTPPTGELFQLDNQASQRIVQLEFELNQTRENLQAVIEELETTNEEQQATNEELVASNEELQSTNEELHSVNEELHTVNTEYQSKIQQLVELNNDVDNLLQSTDIGVVFLDMQLQIRKFTSAATKAISLEHRFSNQFFILQDETFNLKTTVSALTSQPNVKKF